MTWRGEGEGVEQLGKGDEEGPHNLERGKGWGRTTRKGRRGQFIIPPFPLTSLTKTSHQ